MRSFVRWLGLAGTLIVLAGLLGSDRAAAAEITGQIDGFELAAQTESLSHGALFVFGFSGEVNGRARTGWGWIEVLHDPLASGGSTAIIGGRGALWIGWRRFRIDVLGGELVSQVSEPDVFDVTAVLDVRDRRGRRVAHDFLDGQLSHLVFPPTIRGSVAPSGP